MVLIKDDLGLDDEIIICDFTNAHEFSQDIKYVNEKLGINIYE